MTAGRLAGDLLARAVRAFTALPESRRAACLAALDGFLARPGPASYLGAARVLEAEAGAFRLEQAGGRAAERSIQRGLERLAGALPADDLALLGALPVGHDLRAGRRLLALAALLEAHAELQGRVEPRLEELRRWLQASAAEDAVEPPTRRTLRRVAPARRVGRR